MDRLHAVLDPWLGKPRYKQTKRGITFSYRFTCEQTPRTSLRLKVEINTREHFSFFGLQSMPFEVRSRWFEGTCRIPTYSLNELLATKLRALYQRRKGRDLFDLGFALQHDDAEPRQILAAFHAYMDYDGQFVTKACLQENIALKLRDPAFSADLTPLLRPGFTWEPDVMSARVVEFLASRLD